MSKFSMQEYQTIRLDTHKAIQKLLDATILIHEEKCQDTDCLIQKAVVAGKATYDTALEGVKNGRLDALEIVLTSIQVLKFLSLSLRSTADSTLSNDDLATAKTLLKDLIGRKPFGSDLN